MSESTEFPLVDESIVRRFDHDCRTNWPVRLESYLPPSDALHFAGTLEELVAVEMEYAWKRWDSENKGIDEITPPDLLEQYVERFPQIRDSAALSRLAKHECRLRLQHGHDVTPAQYRTRIPEMRELSAEFWQELDTICTSPPGTTEPPQQFDRYEVIEEQGHGGFATVWRAADPKLGRDVALKQLRGELARRPDLRNRFLVEARIAARLEHPGIVPVHDLADDDDEQPYYTMKLVRGETLSVAIRSFHKQPPDGAFQSVAFRRLLESLLAVLRTMEYAHAQGVIHRDLKPHNIVVGQYGETIILDWGLAKIVGADARVEDEDTPPTDPHDTDIEATQPGEIKGTPAYMSPEQAAGRASDVDQRSDIYALGVILYELLAGRLPFRGNSTADVLHQVISLDPQPPSSKQRGVPRALEAICLKALRKSPDRRYQEVSEFTADMERFLADEPVLAWREPVRSRIFRWMRRHRSWTLAGAAALLIAAGVSAIAAVLVNEQRKLAEESEQTALAAESREKSARARETVAKIAALDLARSEEEARRAERRQREAAEWRLVRSYVQNGRGRLAQIDYLGALPWFVKALQIDQSKPDEADVHRRRINTLLRRCPQLAQLTFLSDSLQSARFSDDGHHLFVVGKNSLHVLDGESGKPTRRVDFGHPATRALLGPRNKLIATSHISVDGTELRIFNVSTGERVCRWRLVHVPAESRFFTVHNLAFSADGSLLAVSSSTGSGAKQVNFCRVWKTDDGTPVTAALPHGKQIAEAVFTPDGKRLVTGSWDKTAVIWDIVTGKPIQSLKHESLVTRLAVSPDGKQLVTCSRNVAHFWKLPSGDKSFDVRYPPGLGESVMRVLFSGDGKYLATVNNSHNVRIWDAATGGLISQYGRHDGLITHLEFAKGAPLVLTASSDGTGRCWTAQGGNPAFVFLRHAGQVNGITITPDRRRFATIGKDGTVRLWGPKAQGGPAWRSLKHPERFIKTVGFSPDSKLAMTVARNGEKSVVRLWKTSDGKQFGPDTEYPADVTQMEFNTKGDRLLSVCTSRLRNVNSHYVEVRDVNTGQTAGDPLRHNGFINRAKFSADGRFVVTASNDRTAKLLRFGANPKRLVFKHPGFVSDVDVGGDGDIIVTACSDKHVRVWSTATGKLLYEPLPHPAAVRHVSLSRDGKIVLATCASLEPQKLQGLVFAWDVATGRSLFGNLAHDNYRRAAFSPDGRTFFAFPTKSTIQLYRSADGQKIGKPLRHRKAIISARFSSDGRLIATGSTDQTARVWNVSDATPVTPSIFIGATVSSVSFSANSRYLLTTTMGNTVDVHDARTGERVSPQMNLDFFDVDAAFSPDMRHVLTAGRSARLWHFAPLTNSVAELNALVEVLSGHRIDDVESMVPLSEDELKSRWQRLAPRQLNRNRK